MIQGGREGEGRNGEGAKRFRSDNGMMSRMTRMSNKNIPQKWKSAWPEHDQVRDIIEAPGLEMNTLGDV